MSNVEELDFEVWNLNLKNSDGVWELYWRADEVEELFSQYQRLAGPVDISWIKTMPEGSGYLPVVDGKVDSEHCQITKTRITAPAE